MTTDDLPSLITPWICNRALNLYASRNERRFASELRHRPHTSEPEATSGDESYIMLPGRQGNETKSQL